MLARGRPAPAPNPLLEAVASKNQVGLALGAVWGKQVGRRGAPWCEMLQKMNHPTAILRDTVGTTSKAMGESDAKGSAMHATEYLFEDRPFIWGTANSAYQCEGAWNIDGKGLGEWDYFNAHSPLNIHDADGTVASDFYHRFEEDIRLAAEGGQNSLRLSVSWSRILPDGRGAVNEAGIAFYNRVIDACLAHGVEPNVTLFQYDLPFAIAREGGWSNVATADAFAAYARVCFERFGDRVKLWSTVDEPQYCSYCANLLGIYPPARSLDMHSYLQWQYVQMLASAKAIKIYHDMGLDGAIGVIHQDCNVEVSPSCEQPERVARAADFFYNRMILCPALEGRLPPELDEMLGKLGTYLYRVENDAEIFAAGVVDFMSLNVFCRKFVTDWDGEPTRVEGNTAGSVSNRVEGQVIAPLFKTAYDPSVPHNAWGRELLPRVMYSSLMRVKAQYGNPRMVAENGYGAYEKADGQGVICDEGRIEFLRSTIDHLCRAREEGAHVCGYYYWCTMDLYSWINGYEKRYGLVRVDFEHGLARYPKKSWYWYRDMIKSNG